MKAAVPMNAMEAQIQSLPKLMDESYPAVAERVTAALTTPDIFSIQNIIITGCGDSLFAGMAVQMAFEQWTGKRVTVMNALDAARYFPRKRIGNAPNNPLLIAVSCSGKVSRVCEAAERFASGGGLTLAVTRDESSPLASICSRVVTMPIPAMPSSPGVRSYAVSLITLYELARRIGQVNGRLERSRVRELHDLFRTVGSRYADILEHTVPAVQEIAAVWQTEPFIEFVAAGPLESAARYGAAKMYEACGRHGIYSDTETWFHLNFFLRNPVSPVCCFTGYRSRSGSRMEELLQAASDMGKRVIAIGEDESGLPEGSSTIRILKIPSSGDEALSPLTLWLPAAVLASELSVLIGESFGRGDDQPWRALKDRKLTMSSRKLIL